MAKQPQSFFLEEWLQTVSFMSNKMSGSVHSSASAQAIIQAWADLRDSLQNKSFNSQHTQALKILVSSQASIYVADPQAKVLVSILSSQHLTLPQDTFPLFLRLLYIWVRKSRQFSPLIDSAIEVIVNILYKHSGSEGTSEGILLLGAFSFQQSASNKSKTACLDLLCKLLEENYKGLSFSDELASHALAGAGYALSSSLSTHFGRILDTLLCVWGQGGSAESISQGVMLLHLVEWALSNALQLRSLDKLDCVRDPLENVRPIHSSAALIITAGGVLRAMSRSGSSGFLHLKNSAEGCIDIVVRDFVTAANWFGPGNEHRHSFLLQCIALALARAGSISYRPSLFVALAQALLTEIFPLRRFYNKILNFSGESLGVVLHEIKQHLGSVIFKEAGAATGFFCKMYASANEDSRSTVENLIWDYCQEVYLLHRQTSFVLLGMGDNIIGEIEKIAESAFLMVVVFALGVTKHKFNSRINEVDQLQTSVRILVSFSCMEYFRRMRLPEYMDTIRTVIVSLQENESACISFVESIPSYDDLTKKHGSSSTSKVVDLWATDEVQTARIVFYMRVIPTFVEHIPASVFEKVVIPTMFLYMGHPNGKVARYSHSMFAAFISSGKEPVSDERVLLKEKLVFYYIQRSLEGYPGITPFEGMASGVAALVRHLPAGSPSIFYCIHCLVEKAKSLCSENWEAESEPSNKLLDLLLRLLSLVDIQVLPSLMKLLAQLIIQLPVEAQNMLLNQLYQQIAESDDVTRKPALISWLQSLSYLCSQGADRKEPHLVGQIASARSPGSVTFNRVNARL